MEEPPKEENPSHLFGGVDSISSLPDEMLHHILSFVPTSVAITTSVLSKRWRHVWCKTPYLSFPHITSSSIESILETLDSYTAAKIMRFHLHVDSETWEDSERSNHVDSLIKFAISRNVEKLSLVLKAYYVFPDFFFSNPSLKQLIGDSLNYMRPKCTVSWTSLQNLSLSNSSLDESFPKLLSGSPMLESLKLQSCSLSCIDLSGSPRLRRLDLEFFNSFPRKCHIVAPHIHYLRMIDFAQKYSLVDVSSLIEANIDTIYYLPRVWCTQDDTPKDDYQVMMQTMLESLQNVENLTVGLSFLQMLSVAEFSGVHFPTFKVKTLTLKTTILRSAVLGIAKLLQNSPELKKIVFYKTEDWNSSVEKYVNLYMEPQDPQDLIFPAKSALKVKLLHVHLI
ncbi:putative F-box/LRR-repeat protein [Raphanus sativus]|nr:putative F-box/LRR-repeat protein [Raphanus sativus]